MPVYEVQKGGRTFEVDAPSMEAAAAVFAGKQTATNSDAGISPGLAVGGGMAVAPAVVGGIRAAAAAAPRMVPKIAPALTAVAVADDLRKGNVRQAAYDAVGGTVASRYVPKVVKPIAAGVANAARNTGIITRLANAMGRYAGPAGLAIDALLTPGHQYNETPEQVAARQAEFQRRYDAMRRR
jgi:hypothetical protein